MDSLRDGFYYFSPPETPFYPGIHQLGSRNWTSDEREPPPALGEWDGEQTWYRGDPPALRPLPVLVGDADAIANGDRIGLTVVPDRSANCHPILPPPCYSEEESVFAKTNILDCVFAFKTAQIIGLAYANLASAEAAVTALLGPDAVVSSFPQPNAFVPAGVIAIIGDTAVLWLTGTTNYQQAAVQGFYFGTGPIDQGFYSASAADEVAALFIADELNAAGAGAIERIILTGHSFGGAICIVLAAKMLLANPNRNVQLLTLGAPAAGDQRMANILATAFQMHYANARDPVPFLPPRGMLFAGLLPIIGPGLALLFDEYVKQPNVLTITEEGTFVHERPEDRPDDLIAVAVTAIAAALDTPTFAAHGVNEYARRICNACKCVPQPCPQPPSPALGFTAALENFQYRFQGVLTVNSFQPPVPAVPIAYHANGLPRAWTTDQAAPFAIVIEAFFDADGRYSSFRVNFAPIPTDPVWLCYWDLTYAQILANNDLFILPTVFNAPLPGDDFFGHGGLDINSHPA